MPCLNEAETIAHCIEKSMRSLAGLGVQGEVLIADNGSTDGSQKIATDLGARVVPVAAKGYGNALRGGIAAARGKFVIMADADDSYDFSKIGPFVEKLREGNDLVMGCRMPRAGGTIMPGAMPWKHRWIGNPVLTFIGRLFFRCPAHDFHCGLRGFTKTAYERMNLHTTGMEFASEMVIKATMSGMKMDEVPITLHKDGRSRPPHLRSWRDGWRHLRFMLLFCPKWLFLVPGASLLAAGLLGMALLSAGRLNLPGGVGMDVGTLVVAAMFFLLGFQTIWTGIFAKTYATTAGLIPENESFKKLTGLLSLERGIVAGLLFALLGLGGLMFATLIWKQQGFGDLPLEENVRRLILSTTSVMFGAQVILCSFFLSVLRLPILNDRPMVED